MHGKLAGHSWSPAPSHAGHLQSFAACPCAHKPRTWPMQWMLVDAVAAGASENGSLTGVFPKPK